MDKKKLIEELVEELNKYSYEYYVLGNSSVTDKDYDKKYYELANKNKKECIELMYNYYIDKSKEANKNGGRDNITVMLFGGERR